VLEYSALYTTAKQIKDPPRMVLSKTSSPIKIHTQTGPKNTSPSISMVSCVAGTNFEPKVYKTRPPPTWKTPKMKIMKKSLLIS